MSFSDFCCASDSTGLRSAALVFAAVVMVAVLARLRGGGSRPLPVSETFLAGPFKVFRAPLFVFFALLMTALARLPRGGAVDSSSNVRVSVAVVIGLEGGTKIFFVEEAAAVLEDFRVASDMAVVIVGNKSMWRRVC